MLNIEPAGYAALPGFLALAASFLMVPDIRRTIRLRFPVFLCQPLCASALPVFFLFMMILFFLESGHAAIAFPAGLLSTILFLVYALALFRTAAGSSSPGEGHMGSWSLCLAAGGLALVVSGIYTAIFTWENIFILNVFVFGAALVPVFFTIGGIPVKESEKTEAGRAVLSADFYLSFLCLLAAAMAMGASMTEYQRVWLGLPVLFAMAGLKVFLIAALLIRAVNRHRPWFDISIRFLSASLIIVILYVLTGEGTGEIASDVIAEQEFFDRMGPFWACMTGALAGGLLIILNRRSETDSGMTGDSLTPAFSLYFMAVCLWIAHLFADFYGIALAGMGCFGAVCLPSGRQLIRDAGNHRGAICSLRTGASAFSTLAVAAACLMRVGGAADFESGLAGFAGAALLGGLLLGAGMACVMRCFIQGVSRGVSRETGIHLPFTSPEISALLAFISFPVLVGLIVCPEALGGFVAGMVLTGVFEVFRMGRKGGSEAAGGLNGLTRLALLAILAAAPFVGF